MTEGSLEKHDKPMCVRLWLEVGHACEPRVSPTGRALALDWRVWVRGPRGEDISSFVHKVVFHLHPASAFVYPKRVIQEPPYEIQESGCASIDIPIHVYLKHSSEPKKIRLRYSLHVENNASGGSGSRSVYYDLENPPERLWRALMQGGGEVIARTGPLGRAVFVEPLSARKPAAKKCKQIAADEVCAKCGDAAKVDLRKQLRSVSMTDEEIGRVSQLYASLVRYEKSEAPLVLPQFWDPIYRVPELPASLRSALASVEADYAMHSPTL